MKKVFITLSFAALISGACSNENNSKTDLTEQEQAAVDSTILSDQEQMDSLENAMKALIGEDSSANANHDDHDHEGHSH